MNILITGGTGSLGSALAKEFSKDSTNHLTILNKDGHKQAAIRRVLPVDTRYILADICDRDALDWACKGQDVVIAAAALKRLEQGQIYPSEFVRVNIGGIENTARAATQAGVKLCLMVSTDKAPNSANCYGATKLIAEQVWKLHNNSSRYFATLRYGNVLGSNGSVWHLWQDQMKRNGRIVVRTPEPTRFVLTIDHAVELVKEALRVMPTVSGCTFLPANLPAFSLYDLAREICPDDNYWDMEYLGSGEKRHEVLLGEEEFAKRVDGGELWATCNRANMTQEDIDALSDRRRFSSSTACRLTGKQVAALMQGMVQ
jgi:FlaA1/EpsC-like NDP-sugar epimerase